MMFLDISNMYFDNARPWELARLPEDPEAQAKLRTVIYMSLECLRVSGVLLQPVVPGLASKLLDRMGLGEHERGANTLKFGYLDGQVLAADKSPLVQKIEGK